MEMFAGHTKVLFKQSLVKTESPPPGQASSSDSLLHFGITRTFSPRTSGQGIASISHAPSHNGDPQTGHNPGGISVEAWQYHSQNPQLHQPTCEDDPFSPSPFAMRSPQPTISSPEFTSYPPMSCDSTPLVASQDDYAGLGDISMDLNFGMAMTGDSGMDAQWISFMRDSGFLDGAL